MENEKMNVYEFGRRLLNAGDLDPVYVVVYHARKAGDLPDVYFKSWLLAYWCFYHVGTASWVSQPGDGFWERMATAAGSKEYPRSSERRHFRGENAKKSVKFLGDTGLNSLFRELDAAGPTAEDVMGVVRSWVGFGPWIAFKVADMLERLAVRPVSFSADSVLYDSPREAAELLWRMEHPGQGYRSETRDEGRWALNRIIGELGGERAPPDFARPFAEQEAETVLCKWKSYLGGHYHIGEDVAAVRRGLAQFGRCKTAQRLYRAGKVGDLW